ncbi:MAG: FAD-dependent oxidoreductase [Pseudomonadota bacterium]
MVSERYKTAFTLYPYQKVHAQNAQTPERFPVVVVGGGPVGLSVALDLSRKDVPILLLDDHEGAGEGSRAICFAKRTLEIADRLGAGQAVVDKGIVWNLGKVFHREHKIFEFDLQPELGNRRPAFVNLQQPYFEKYLVDQIRVAQQQGAPIEIRGKNAVSNISCGESSVLLTVGTPDGEYHVVADWVIACDGVHSSLRQLMGLSFDGRVFEDNFLIADVKMRAHFPTERWFWFDPPFENAGASALLHKQPDDVWRIDFQLGWDIDRAQELQEDKVRARVDAMLGSEISYELIWSSIYTFKCRRLKRFRHGRLLFAGDAAHQVSPFGARGANSGVQDADNLAWKLALVVKGKAQEPLLDSYSDERVQAADENILHSSRTTDFLTPKTKMSGIFRNAVLDLAQDCAFARSLVNSGRLSVPCVYETGPLNGPDRLSGVPGTRVGAPCPDAPFEDGYLLDLLGDEFALLSINCDAPQIAEVDGLVLRHIAMETAHADTLGVLAARYLGGHSTAVYLIRPDQHIAARWARATAADVTDAVRHAIGRG